MTTTKSSVRPDTDRILVDIGSYVADGAIDSDLAYDTARYAFMDALGCGLLALSAPECTKLLGPIVPGTSVPLGVRVPGTQFELDPVWGAFNIGCMVRWLDFNDTFLASEWGHPSDNLGAILASADYMDRRARAGGRERLTMRHVLTALIKAYEIQGVLSLGNSLNRAGMDHILLVRVASTAVATEMLGGGAEEISNAVSNAWIDGSSLRVYRHAPNAGSRKSWASADATSRAVWLALVALAGEMGYPSSLTAGTWGFSDALLRGVPLVQERHYGSYVMENVLFKVSFPAEFHAQTAVECALQLHEQVKDRLDDVESVTIGSQESAIRIIDKTGPLYNPADRDHSLQYMVAIGLIFGEVTSAHYESEIAADPRIDDLRNKMTVVEDPRFSKEYLDPEKRSIANSVQVRFKDGSVTDKVAVEYPLGHRRRRDEGITLLIGKFRANLISRFPVRRAEAIMDLCLDRKRLESMPVDEFMEMLVM